MRPEGSNEIGIGELAYLRGKEIVLATLIHELAHIAGAPGGESRAVEDALIHCGLGKQSEADHNINDPSTPYDPDARGWEPDAQARATKMATLARLLVRAKLTAEAPTILRKAGEQTTEADFREVEAYARELCTAASKPEPHRARPRAIPTVRELGQQWVRGELHRRYPDQIPRKRTAADDAGRLAAHIYPTIGDKRIDEVTLDDCERVMRTIPESAARARRGADRTGHRSSAMIDRSKRAARSFAELDLGSPAHRSHSGAGPAPQPISRHRAC